MRMHLMAAVAGGGWDAHERKFLRHVINRGPPADGGYPTDGDLHQMSDDGGPIAPDPARWSDPEWQDYPAQGDVPPEPAEVGESGTFDDAPPPTPAVPERSRWAMRRNRVGMMDRWRAACERAFRQGLGNDGPPGRHGL